MLPSALSVSPLSAGPPCIMRSVSIRATNRRRCNLLIGLSYSKEGQPSSQLRTRLLLDIRSDGAQAAADKPLYDLCVVAAYLLFFFGFTMLGLPFSIKPPDLRSGGCFAAARILLRSPTNRAKAQRAFLPRPPPPVCLRSCPHVRRRKASGLVRSLPSSITSPLCESMRHR
jgi:hypothetical protein